MYKEPKIEVFKGKGRLWYFRVIAANGQIVAQSEGYTQKQNAKKSAHRLWDIIKSADVIVV